MNNGIIITISGPSGVGKTAVKKLIQRDSPSNWGFPITTTTRSPREGEINGVDYIFKTKEEFFYFPKNLVCGTCLNGNWYAIDKNYLDLDNAINFLILDPQGVDEAHKAWPNKVFSVMLAADEETIADRLHQRGNVPENDIDFSNLSVDLIIVNHIMERTAEIICSVASLLYFEQEEKQATI